MREIITDEKLLRTKSVDVEPTEDISDIVNDLKQQLLAHDNWVALSAIQLGVNKRIIALKVGKRKDPKIEIYVNPVIISQKSLVVVYDEGCACFPGVFLNTMRFFRVNIKDKDNKIWSFVNRLAFAIQHEIDHLDSILFFDRKIRGEKNEDIRRS